MIVEPPMFGVYKYNEGQAHQWSADLQSLVHIIVKRPPTVPPTCRGHQWPADLPSIENRDIQLLQGALALMHMMGVLSAT